MLTIGLALIRQCKAARGTGEETHAEAAFEFCEPARNDWQRHRQRTRRRRQAALAQHGEEGALALPVEKIHAHTFHASR